MSIEHITNLRCVRCQTSYGLDVKYTCAKCGLEGVLDIEYDYDRVAHTLTRESLTGREFTHWRYRELLPIAADAQLPHLQVGWTPVYAAPRIAAELGLPAVFIKDDG